MQTQRAPSAHHAAVALRNSHTAKEFPHTGQCGPARDSELPGWQMSRHQTPW